MFKVTRQVAARGEVCSLGCIVENCASQKRKIER